MSGSSTQRPPCRRLHIKYREFSINDPHQEPSIIAENPCKYRDFRDCRSRLHAAGENDKRTRGNTIYLGSSLSSLAIFGYDCTVFSGTVITVFSCQRKPCICATDFGALPYPPPPFRKPPKKGPITGKLLQDRAEFRMEIQKKSPGERIPSGPFGSGYAGQCVRFAWDGDKRC